MVLAAMGPLPLISMFSVSAPRTTETPLIRLTEPAFCGGPSATLSCETVAAAMDALPTANRTIPSSCFSLISLFSPCGGASRRSCAALLEPQTSSSRSEISPYVTTTTLVLLPLGSALLLDCLILVTAYCLFLDTNSFPITQSYEVGTSFFTTSRAVSRPKASFPYSRKMMESLVIFSTLPLNTWSFSRRK